MRPFNLISQFLKDFSFNSPNTPELFFSQEDSSAKIETNIDIQVKGAKNNLYMVNLLVKLDSILDKNQQPIFSISIDYRGLVEIEHPDNDEIVKKTLMIDVPQFLFPYIHHLVLQISSDSGFPPYSMQPFDFEMLYKDKEDNKSVDFFDI
ncbi:MAG: protein-export chaperone SecB [Alistipes sp.]|nr:protein-export chaperone SecB [Alistipes sp.]